MAQPKQTVVSFRVDEHLAEVLNNLPDKSAFIRDAVLHRVHAVCPCCQGRGVMPQVVADWLSAHMPHSESVECTCCHYRYPLELVRAEIEQTGPGAFVCTHCTGPDHLH